MCLSGWNFEAECNRIEIEDITLDWYSSMLINQTINSEWAVSKRNFCETFADKDMSPIRYAMLYKYRQGSLLEYALKKRDYYLLEINKSIDKLTVIDLIATGL